MNTSSDIDAEIAARDPVAERAERQMQVMAQLSEVGMELLRALKAQVCDGGPVVMKGDPASLYVKMSRAVRQCIALEAKIAQALREWLSLSEAERAERRAVVAAKAADAEAAPEIDEPEEIERGIEGLRAEAERGESERGERAERFWADHYVIEDEGSFLDIVTKVCRDLGVTPDWSQWSEDGPEDLVSKAVGAVVFQPGARLNLASGPWPVGRGASPRGPPT